MKILALVTASLLVMLTLAACGGGGDSSTTPAAKTIISGFASKGPIINGVVKIYSVTNGTKDKLLKQTTTDDKGNYTTDIGNYTGSVFVEVSGNYTDEATGNPMTISADSPLRAALPSAQGSVSLSVTPLTELAVVKMGSNLSPASINAYNAMISENFKVDIIATLPVAPTSGALTAAGVSQAQKDYTLALAVVSQMANGGDLTATLSTLSQGITTAGMSSGTAASFQAALTAFVSPANTNNHTGVIDTTSTNLVNAGTLTKNYNLVFQGTFAPGGVDGLQFDLSLPAGVTLNSDGATSAVMASSLAYSNTAYSGATKYSSGKVTIGIITTSGISAGTVATLTCNIPAGTTAPGASLFSVTNLKSTDKNGVAVAGTTIAIQ